jgi:predicted  nucleic acid-binding Zn-ribbon protein
MTSSIENYKRFIEDYKKQNALIATMNDPLKEKLEAIAENETAIKSLEEEIDIYTAQRYYLNHYFDMNCDWEKNQVWVGIEVDPSYLNGKFKEETN